MAHVLRVVFWTFLMKHSLHFINGNDIGNIAHNKYTSQYLDTNPTNIDVWDANNAVDGVNNCPVVNKDYFTLSSYSSYPWWQVDLGKVYNIQRIKVFGRKGGEADIQLKGFQVHLSETESDLNDGNNVVTYDSSVYPSDGIFDIPVAARKARFCRLQIDASTGQRRPIVLCEVEVYGTEPDLIQRIRTRVNVTMGSAINYGRIDYSKNNAIDNKYSTIPDACGCCSGTGGENWWQIDLGRNYLMQEIKIYGRTDGSWLQQNGPLVIKVGKTASSLDVLQNTPTDAKQSFSLTLSTPTFLRYIRIEKSGGLMMICEVKVFDKICDPGKYGPDCSSTCGQCNDSSISCNIENGHCPHGCAAGYKGDTCTVPCGPGEYGPNCAFNCGQCKDGNTTCNNGNGQCPNGCASGYKGRLCKSPCDPGEYGPDCTSHCGNCRDGNTSCNTDNGYCRDGCSSGYKGNLCYLHCAPGEFGPNCKSNCGYCHNGNTTCDTYNGHCPAGCAAGYKGDFCNITCGSGEYGPNCTSQCGQCHGGNTSCNIENGHCPLGCADGYKNDTCTIPCSPGEYGPNCAFNCGQCRDGNTTCNNGNGQCPNGCASGYKGPFCKSPCDPGEHGPGCTSHCGHCRDGNTMCNINNGSCPYGCSSGYKEDLCSIRCAPGEFGPNCASNCGYCHDGNTTCDTNNGHCPAGCAAGYKGDFCKTKCGLRRFGKNCFEACHCDKCHHINGSCSFFLMQCHPGYQGDSCTEITTESTPVGAIVGGVFAVLVAVAVAVVVVFIIRRRKLKKNMPAKNISNKPPRGSNQGKLDAYDLRNNASVNLTVSNEKAANEGDYYSFNDSAPGIKIHELWSYIREKMKNNREHLYEEFATLPTGLVHKHEVAAEERYKGKNRYKEMYAYDHSRVPLEKARPDDPDYINACFINGYEKVNKFIASQGPTKNMIDEFWQMVWQQKAEKIVMVTNLIEMASIKCLQYWPEKGDTCSHGGIDISYIDTKEFQDYNIRTWEAVKTGSKPRRIRQFHFKTWPDKDVPDSAWCLVDFWKAVDTKSLANESPIVVHCSAGVGRTGTFIALDNLIHQAKAEKCVRPLQMVQTLRRQRVNMVQTKEQYVYLHEAVAEALLIGTHHVFSKQFDSFYKHMVNKEPGSSRTRIHEQFVLIEKENAEESVHEGGHEYGNMESLRSENAYRPKLKARGSNIVQRLGNIFLPNYANKNTFLVGKSPTEETLEEFWSLIEEQHITTVIMVTSQSHAAYKTCQYLGSSEGNQIGKFKVNCIHEKQNKAFQEKCFSFKDVNHEDEDYPTTICQFEFLAWDDGDDTPMAVQPMLDILEAVNRWQPHLGETRPILIHCESGFCRSGVVAVLLNEVHRVQDNKGQINIVDSVMTMKQRKKDIVQNPAQLRYIYDVMQEHVKQIDVYQNL